LILSISFRAIQELSLSQFQCKLEALVLARSFASRLLSRRPLPQSSYRIDFSTLALDTAKAVINGLRQCKM
jgi:hypothetical protein